MCPLVVVCRVLLLFGVVCCCVFVVVVSCCYLFVVVVCCSLLIFGFAFWGFVCGLFLAPIVQRLLLGVRCVLFVVRYRCGVLFVAWRGGLLACFGSAAVLC